MNIETNKKKNYLIIFFSLVILSIIVRIYYTSLSLPLSLDAIDFFQYAVMTSREGFFHDEYIKTNFGWPNFVSLFFHFGQSSMIDLMNIQKIIGIIISGISGIPLFFILKKFFDNNVAITSASMFIFNPNLILNSTSGISDSFFMLFVILSILFLFTKNQRFSYCSFIFIAIASLVRYEGILLLFPILVSHIIKINEYRYLKRNLIIGISIFLLIIIPIEFINIENTGNAQIFSQIMYRTDYIDYTIINKNIDPDDEVFSTSDQNNTEIFFKNSIFGFIKFLGWSLIPNLIVFVLFGLVVISKKISKNRITLFLYILMISIPAFYAYGRGFEDLRYVMFFFPVLVIFSGFGINYIHKLVGKNIFPTLIIIIFVSSLIFIQMKGLDNQYEQDMYEASLILVNTASGVNNYEGNKFVKVAELENNWPSLLPQNEFGKSIYNVKKFQVEDYTSVSKFILENSSKGLSHILVKEGDNNGFFDDVFYNEELYPYLEKIYDSGQNNIKTEYKIFKIKYENLN